MLQCYNKREVVSVFAMLKWAGGCSVATIMREFTHTHVITHNISWGSYVPVKGPAHNYCRSLTTLACEGGIW